MEHDEGASKMNEQYLKTMEEKIFHVKPHEASIKIPGELATKMDEVKKSLTPHHQEPKRKTSKCVIYTASDGYSAQQFPKELLKQLSEHKKFERQQRKCTNSEEILNLGRPEIYVKESTVQGREDYVKGNRNARRIPPKRNVHLFNPNYVHDKAVLPSYASLGKTLLESIRTKVFGIRQEDNSNKMNDDEWCCDPSSCYNLTAKLPKETRMSNLTTKQQQQPPKFCASCSKQIRNIRTSDAQTSPIASTTQLTPTKTPRIIPCPLNLLCDRGIHLGKCTSEVRMKTRFPVCGQDCTCRDNGFYSKLTTTYPGKAEPVIETNVVCQVQATSEEVNGSESLADSSSDVSIALEAKSSMETIFKLLEPQKEQLDAEGVPEKELPTLPIKKELVTEDVKPTSSPEMNGLNGHANGEMNGCGDIITQNQQKGCWTIGLINSKYRYLTAETFGFKINANGASLKKKQIWTLEPESANNGESLIYLRSHLAKYLAVDSFGNVTCESEEKEPGCQFQISVSEDGSGRWALKNVVRGYFLGSTLDKLTCTAKVPGDAEFWHTHLAARPQVNLRSVGRKRFAHLSENLDEIHVDANIPWGEDTLFTLEFRLDESGKYAIHTCNNKYLSMGGKLVDSCNKDCLFSAEYHSGQLALRDRTGAYLSPIGSKAVLKTRSNTVTKDELFSLEDSLPQASFVASLNSRFVSVKQGVDVTANQDEISDHETFQLEFDWSTKRWYIRTMQDRYWTLETGGGIQASGDKRSSNALFDLVWQSDGSLAFRANNGRYVITKRSGHLYATADAIEDNCKYFFYLINRPILVLKCEQGFVGFKSASSPKLECNKATYECIQVERGEKGVVHFKGQNGKYWHVDSEGVTADSDTQEGFYLELREPTRLCIKSLNGNYLTASKNGLFRLGDTNIENATQWEY